MPQKPSYTPEQRAKAMTRNHALNYAREHGYNLVREGQSYRLAEHNSMVFTQDGSWHWNSRGLHGRAVEFIASYELDDAPGAIVQAILILAGEADSFGAISPSPPPPRQERVPFCLPSRSKTKRHLYAYLCQTRGIPLNVVEKMIDQGILYESVTETSGGRQFYNACFVSYDADGKACSAFLRGLYSTGKAFRMEVEGGDKRWGWLLRGERPKEVYVFEACIDAASFVALRLRKGESPLRDADYLALGGLSFDPLQNYLSRHPDVTTVYLMLDADQPGQAAATRFRKLLIEQGYQPQILLPSCGKDWNDTLLQTTKFDPIFKEELL